MIKKLKHVAARIASMSAHELWVRSSQELAKRWDMAQTRLGRGWASAPLPVTGQFFFTPQQVSSILDLLRRELPEEVSAIISEADRICQHEFDFLGFRGVQFGEEIDWHLDIIHDKRSPLIAWYRIPFLSFEAVGDHKIIWELSRHQHLVTLAKAWRLTGDEKYIQEMMRQWHHWNRSNPYPLGINWASSLEVAFRCLSWIWVERLVADRLPEFAAQVRAAQAVNGRHILRYLSTYFAPNTHLLGEAVALFFLGTLYGVPRWREIGWRLTVEQMDFQVRADGFHFEQSVYYHVYALDFFLHARLLADCNGIAVPEAYNARLEKMFDALAWISQAGIPPRLGDDDGGRLFNPRRNRAEHMTDPLATGALLFQRPEWNVGPPEETAWLLGKTGERSNAISAKGSRAFPDTGIYVMAADGWQLTIDAGPLGWGNGGHGHADLLSVHLAHEGREYLIDPGTGSYMRPKDRDWFRSTAAHNTLEVDSRSQAIPTTSFAWQGIPTVRVERWETHPEFEYFCGSHDGYAPVIHRRHVVRTAGFWLISDEVAGSGEHELAVWWHLGDSSNLTFATDSDWTRSEHQTVQSPAYGAIEAGRAICFRLRTTLPAEFAVAIIPGRQEVRLVSRTHSGARIFAVGDRRVAFRADGTVTCF